MAIRLDMGGMWTHIGGTKSLNWSFLTLVNGMRTSSSFFFRLIMMFIVVSESQKNYKIRDHQMMMFVALKPMEKGKDWSVKIAAAYH